MDSDSWARISSSARRYQLRSDLYRGEEREGDEEPRPEFLCPFCGEDFDIVGLCCHMDEEHAIEAKNGVCPVCAKKRRRRFRRAGSNLLFSILRKEAREGKLQSLHGGSPFFIPSSHDEPDSLLTSFIYNPPVVDEPSSVHIQPVSSIETCSMSESSVVPTDRVVQQRKLSEEDKIEKAHKCEFVQGLLLSTFLDDN